MGTTLTIVTTILAMLALAAVSLLVWLYTWRARGGARYPLRRIPAYEAIRGFMDTIAERGKTVHLSLGSAGIGGEETVAVSAGLAVLRHLAEHGASLETAPIVTVADPVLLLVAQDTLYRAYERMGHASRYRSTDVRLVAPDAAAYAIGAQDLISDPGVDANVMVGALGDEYLLMGEAGAQRGIVQVAGSNAVNTHPFMVATADHVLVGEEMYAAGAYLSGDPAQVASLRVQDVLRVAIAGIIVLGIVVKTLLG
ncbi:MAG: hypothetical protein JXA09_12365 [Anaerolineae bacterium]|nr:hypothetical protein [Anaerolineae bacterium]